MSNARVFNLTAGALKPGPSLVIIRAPDGMTTASQDYSIRKGDIDLASIQTKLAKGTLISVLYPQVPPTFAYLRVDSWTARDNPGGYTIVSVEFKGAFVTEGDFTFEGSVVYSRTNALREASIFKSPKFLAAVTAGTTTRESLRLGSIGKAVKAPESTGTSYVIKDDAGNTLETITDETLRWWWDHIVEQENHAYEVATSEWTKTATGKGTLPASKMTNFGKIDTPPGNPQAPPGDVWKYDGATETISVSGDGANSYSQTWTSGDWPTQVYAP